MRSQKSIRAIIFDLDDTLVGSDDFYARALRKMKINPTGKPFLEARSQMKAQLPSGHVAARNRMLYFKRMLDNQKRGYGLAALKMMAQYEALLQTMTRAQWKQLKRDVLIKKLSRRYRLVILTNENLRTQLAKLQAIDPKQQYFERVFTSEEVGEEKPSSKGFQLCLRYLKLPAKQVLSIGNSIEGDIAPALRLGMSAILSREFLPSSGRMPPGCVSVDKLEDLSDIL